MEMDKIIVNLPVKSDIEGNVNLWYSVGIRKRDI